MSKITKIEENLKKEIFPDLKLGRSNWDLNHTKAVVHHVKNLLKYHPALDEVVLIASAYAHDWGYSNLLGANLNPTIEDIRGYKAQHMERGAILISDLMRGNKEFEVIGEEDQKRIVHLVSVHDKLDELRDEDELVLMEADTLGGLDINFVKPTFDKESNEKYLEGVIKKRIPKFITSEARELAFELIGARKGLYLE